MIRVRPTFFGRLRAVTQSRATVETAAGGTAPASVRPLPPLGSLAGNYWRHTPLAHADNASGFVEYLRRTERGGE